MRQRHDRYILEGTKPVPVAALRTWCRWLETADRRVARTTVAPDVEVITIFLGLDGQWGAGPPLVFETRVVQVDPTPRPGRRRFDDFRTRYSTWQEAEHGHVALCARVRQALAVTALPPARPARCAKSASMRQRSDCSPRPGAASGG